MTRMLVEPRSCDQGRHKNDAFTFSAILPINVLMLLNFLSENISVLVYPSYLSRLTRFTFVGGVVEDANFRIIFTTTIITRSWLNFYARHVQNDLEYGDLGNYLCLASFEQEPTSLRRKPKLTDSL